MMTRDEADQALSQAIADHAAAYGISEPDDEMLSEFVVVAAWIRNVSGSGTTHYTTQYHTPEIPAHVACGLLRLGEDIVRSDDYDG